MVSVVLPTKGRAAQAARCVERFLQTSRGYGVEVVVVTDEDPETVAACRDSGALVLDPPVSRGAIWAWNFGAAIAEGDVLVLGADDLWPMHGWCGEMLERMAAFPEGDGLVGFNDLARRGEELATHYAMSRRYCARYNGGVLACPKYRHFYIDNEANARAKRAGRFVWAEFAVLEHRHPAWQKAPVDAGYAARQPWIDGDAQTFFERAQAGFPDDFDPVVVW